MFFKISEEIFEKVNDICIGVVIAKGVNNRTFNEKIQKLLYDQVKKTEDELKLISIKEIPELKIYKDTMKVFGINSVKFPSSIEALLTRVKKKGNIPNISPAVDIGNYISLKYKLPVGVHDIKTLYEDLTVRLSTDEKMKINDDTKKDSIAVGEPIYTVGNSVRTRRWIWRQMDEGKVDESACDFLFPIDGVASDREKISKACEELANTIKHFFENADVRVGIVDRIHPAIKIDNLNDREKKSKIQ